MDVVSVMAKGNPSDSVLTISDSESSDFAPDKKDVRPSKRRRGSAAKPTKQSLVTKDVGNPDIEDASSYINRPHGPSYHDVSSVAELQEDLLSWFESVRCD